MTEVFKMDGDGSKSELPKNLITPVLENKIEEIDPSNAQSMPSNSIDIIRQELLDPYFISKKYNQKGRDDMGILISENRTKSQDIKAGIGNGENNVSQFEEQRIKLNQLREEKSIMFKKEKMGILVRLKSIFGIKDKMISELEKELKSIELKDDSLFSQIYEEKEKLKKLESQKKEIPNNRELLKGFYEKMKITPLTNEEKKELLKPEVLKNISTEEYIALWRRLNPYFLSHVTRQGFRDHNGMTSHSSGLQEFHNGFMSVLDDDKILRPPMGIGADGLRGRDEESVRKFLDNWVLKAESKDEAAERLIAQLNFTTAAAPKYPDKTAIHFAAQTVADSYYGGESNNEVFFLYPTDVLVSQHNFAFNGWEKDFTKPQSETKWNDVFIWPSLLDNSGIYIDTGLVFLPKNTPVDPETGSVYAYEIKTIDGEEKKVMVEDKKIVSSFIKWIEDLNIESPIVQSHKKSGDNESERKTKIEIIKKEIIGLGLIEGPAMSIACYLYDEFDGINKFKRDNIIGFGESKRDGALKILRKIGANWKRAENTVLSEEYWKKYFIENPQKEPKHLIFYDGDPTLAVKEFKEKNDIKRVDISKDKGELLGFDDHHIKDLRGDTRAWGGYNELIEMANKIIAGHYND
ncbi:hypothetical protein LBMAG33_7170 [Candidatus Levyibacteriota bacterium]|nr:hypothetical protein LBMAG33_7170 [Candidatus Levybacteria bacterium]